MSGFEKQTYTQVPNSLFSIMHEMDECELKVVLYICRYTFGYHRDEVKISTRKLAKAINMSVSSVDKGADSAVKRGLIERVTDGQNTTTWRAIVSDSKSDTPQSDSNIDTGVIQKTNHSVSENESQVGVKERIKKEKYRDPFWDLQHGNTPSLSEEDNKNIEAAKQVEEIVTKLEQGLRLNFPRGTNDQSVYRRILNTGKSIERFIEWVKSEERRLAFAFLYAKDTSSLWRDFPQAFGVAAAETERNGAFYG